MRRTLRILAGRAPGVHENPELGGGGEAQCPLWLPPAPSSDNERVARDRAAHAARTAASGPELGPGDLHHLDPGRLQLRVGLALRS